MATVVLLRRAVRRPAGPRARRLALTFLDRSQRDWLLTLACGAGLAVLLLWTGRHLSRKQEVTVMPERMWDWD